MPVEPTPTGWDLEPAPVEHPHDLWVVGADLEPGTVLAGYRLGLFPMHLPNPASDGSETLLGWWSPQERAVFPLETRPPRTLRRARGRYKIQIDSSFREVMVGCGDPSRPHGWIDAAFIEAYSALHELGWAHSVECWDDEGLAGGVYGVAIGGLFAAESMFQRRPEAAKAALLGLIDVLQSAGDPGLRLLDAQWPTPHLGLLGARTVARAEYGRRLEAALELPAPPSLVDKESRRRASGESREIVRQADEEEE